MRWCLLILLMVIGHSAAAAPGDSGEYFAEYKIGGTSIGDQQTRRDSSELMAGYRWGADERKLGFELGYVDFGPFDSGSPSISQAFYGASVYTSHALKLGVNYNFSLIPQLYVEPRAGLMRLSYRGIQHNFPYNDRHYNETRMGHYVGVGVGVWVTPHFALSMNLDDHIGEFFGDTTALIVFSIGAQVRF
jgi:hypothetical protein